MPTHQGKNHTDILIGGDDDFASQSSEIEFIATYPSSATVEFADLAPRTDRNYSGTELVVRDSAGAVIATFAARYKAWIDRGSSGGPKAIDILNDFAPAPDGGDPNWPLSAVTSTEREWRVDAFDEKGNLYAQLHSTWQLRTTVTSPAATVIQTVVDQTDSLLRVHFIYMKGRSVLLDVVASMPATARVIGPVTADPPDVTDRFTP